jgi:Zn-dependent membrane protease YugP
MTEILTTAPPLAFVFSPTLIVIMVATALASWIVSSTLKRRFNEYSQIPIRFTGAEIAETMLRENGITDVKVIHTPGKLTDHYDPTNKTVNLSEEVYAMNSIAAAAVAAHECGHAIQHAKSYAWLTMRSKMVPTAKIESISSGPMAMPPRANISGMFTRVLLSPLGRLSD